MRVDGFPLVFAPVALKNVISRDYGHRFIAWCGFYDLALTRSLSVLARQGGLLVDVGANVGYFSVLWSGLDAHNRVLAFEPSPRNVCLLRGNVAVQKHPERIQ